MPCTFFTLCCKNSCNPTSTHPANCSTAQVYDGQLEARLSQLVASGLVITVNSDDAAYFGGYAVANYNYLARVTGLGVEQVSVYVCVCVDGGDVKTPAQSKRNTIRKSEEERREGAKGACVCGGGGGGMAGHDLGRRGMGRVACVYYCVWIDVHWVVWVALQSAAHGGFGPVGAMIPGGVCVCACVVAGGGGGSPGFQSPTPPPTTTTPIHAH